jgi:hypothetical protein
MSTTTETTHQAGLHQTNWQAGVLGGIVGATVMAVLIVLMNDAVIGVAIPFALRVRAAEEFGPRARRLRRPRRVLGVVFAGLAGLAGENSTGNLGCLGAAWGVITWLGVVALVMPLWLDAVGSPADPP